MVSPLGRLLRLPTSSNWNPVQQCGDARRWSLWEAISPWPLWGYHCLDKRRTPERPIYRSTIRAHQWKTRLQASRHPLPNTETSGALILRAYNHEKWSLCMNPCNGGFLSEPPEWDGFQRWEQYWPLWVASLHHACLAFCGHRADGPCLPGVEGLAEDRW